MSRNACLIVLALAISLCGCSQAVEKPANLPPLFSVVVSVVQTEGPVAGAFVRLVPTDSSMPWSCGATTDSSGTAVIKTIGKFDGAPAGSYKVTISKLEMTKAAGTNLSNLDAQPTTTPADSYDLIDPQYANPTTTPLELRVEKTAAKVKFDVGPAVRSERKGPR